MRFAKDLKPGDLIVVAYDRTLRHAIFHGRGRTGNPQFYLLPYYNTDVNAWKTNGHMEKLQKGKNPFKHYMIGTGEDRIAKVDVSELNDGDRAAYIGIVNELKTKGIIQ